MVGRMARQRKRQGPLTRWVQHGVFLGLMLGLFVAYTTGNSQVIVGESSAAVRHATEIALNQATTSQENLPTIAGR
jgi:hypothetical protein